MTVILQTQVMTLVQRFTWLNSIGPMIPMIQLGFKLLSFAIIWVLFIFLYMFLPNTRVRWHSGILAGIVAGTLFQTVQWLYVSLQVGAAKYSAIYGGFAALPLFVIWLQFSWLIVLFGAELSFANQNVHTYEFEPDCMNISPAFKKELSLLVCRKIVQDFCAGQAALTAEQLAAELDLPIRLVRDLTWQMTEARIIAPIKTADEKMAAYLPAREVGTLTLAQVLDALDQVGAKTLPVVDTEARQRLQKHLDELAELLHKSAANKLIKDL